MTTANKISAPKGRDIRCSLRNLRLSASSYTTTHCCPLVLTTAQVAFKAVALLQKVFNEDAGSKRVFDRPHGPREAVKMRRWRKNGLGTGVWSAVTEVRQKPFGEDAWW
ncbi:hypothetical protein L596_017980 [Steinernema carpocapsae]|uniref:Uncharacterized protein n=1 Tax=Steinernema carpocapsae TaxID=34508 RepID=A0A4U5N3P0_STECR|nr:hypothetical protein L596_017980 [Steinernema carpocapsae]